MSNSSVLSRIYQAQTMNVKAINSAKKQLKRSLNKALLKGDREAITALTRTYALIYCAWSESSLSKLIHTPDSLSDSEINEIKSQNSIHDKWMKTLIIVLDKVSWTDEKHNTNSNRRNKIEKLIAKYILVPAQLRNKIAHGQWQIALNIENSAINNELTTKLKELNMISIDLWFQVHETMCKIIEDMVKSAQSTHRDYWIYITQIEEIIEKTERYSIDSKISLLKKKATYHHSRE